MTRARRSAPALATVAALTLFGGALLPVAPVAAEPLPQPPVEAPVEPAPVEETPAEESPVEETPAEESPVEETPAEESPVEETPAEEAPVEEGPVDEAPFQALQEQQLTLLGFSDFHGRINDDTLAWAGLIEESRRGREDSTLLISGGDNIGASQFASSVQQDGPTLEVLNALEVDASAVGNHEYDAGAADLSERVIGDGPGNTWTAEDFGDQPGQEFPTAGFPYLAANVTDADGELLAGTEAYTVTEVDGVTVGLIGAVTQQTTALVLPGGIAGVEFGDPVAAINEVAADLSDGDPNNGEADVLVAMLHEGAGSSGDAAAAEAASGQGVFARIVDDLDPGVAAVLNGHTSQEYDLDAPVPGEPERTRPVIQVPEYGEAIAEIELTLDVEGDDVTVVSATAETLATPAYPDLPAEPTAADYDAARAALIAEFDGAAAARLQQVDDAVTSALAFAEEAGSVVLAEAGTPITTAFSGGEYGPEGYTGGSRDDRGNESALGNLVADALLTSLSAEELGGADIAVTNPGGLRSDFEAGDITVADANGVLPFLNNLNTITLTGEQVITMLEQQWQTAAEGDEPPSRSYLQLGLSSNVSYTFDPDAAAGERINQVFVNGAPIDPATDYRIGTFSFLAQGGDNFRVFTEGTDLADSGLVDRDAWFAYLEAFGEAGEPLVADYSKRSTVLTQSTPVSATAGETVEIEVSGLDQTSLGAPEVAEIDAVLLPADGGDLAALFDELAEARDSGGGISTAAQAPDTGISFDSTEVVDGGATVSVELPGDVSGTNQLFLVTDTFSLIGVTLDVAAAEMEAPAPNDPPSGAPAPGPQPDPGAGGGHGSGDDRLADAGASDAMTAIGILGGLLILLGGALLVGRRLLGLRARP